MVKVEVERTIPEQIFEQIAAQVDGRTKPETVDVAREVLVKGRTLVDVAAEFNMSRQRVMVIRDRWYANYLNGVFNQNRPGKRQQWDVKMAKVEVERSIPAQIFDQIATQTHGRTKPETVDVAREVLVKGRTLVDVAAEFNMSRQQVMVIRDRWYASYLKYAAYPPQWITATVTADPDDLKSFLEKTERKRQAFLVKAGERTQVSDD